MSIGPNSRSYYVNRLATNQYQLFWLPYGAKAPEAWDRVTRNTAISLATQERWRRRYEPQHAFKAYTHIRPGRWELDRLAGYITDEEIERRLISAHINGYFVEDSY